MALPKPPARPRGKGGLFKSASASKGKDIARSALDTALKPAETRSTLELSEIKLGSESHQRSGKLGVMRSESKRSTSLTAKANERGELGLAAKVETESGTSSRIGGLRESSSAGVSAGVNLQKGEASLGGQVGRSIEARSIEPGSGRMEQRERSEELQAGASWSERAA
jgi:hypothetical protein